jgi:hypothetical protein
MHKVDIIDLTSFASGTAEWLLSLDEAALVLKPTSYLGWIRLLYEAAPYAPPAPGSGRA